MRAMCRPLAQPRWLNLPPPPIDFLEWDGMVRLCFSRKNKTLGAIFKSKPVLEMLEGNHKTYCALHSLPAPERPVKDTSTPVDVVKSAPLMNPAGPPEPKSSSAKGAGVPFATILAETTGAAKATLTENPAATKPAATVVRILEKRISSSF